MYGRRKSLAVIRGLAAAELRSRAVHCACGREVVVNKIPQAALAVTASI
jgi:hypothetical protein